MPSSFKHRTDPNIRIQRVCKPGTGVVSVAKRKQGGDYPLRG